ncbi:MAG: hypothetical protein EBZ60_08505, partial [Betaproteobacteria bacterium]|nr:hypothetical protein [Betaproteobacteria bacterium]
GTGDIMATGIRSLTTVTATSPYAGLDTVQTALGDALVDVGQENRTVTINGNSTKYRYTVNNKVSSTTTNTGNTFIEYLASYFGIGSVTYAGDSLNSSGRLPSSGAYSYGEFGAMVSGAAGTKDARGCTKAAGTATAYCAYNLQAQIDLFLSQGSPASTDLFVISIGTGDIMATGIRSLTTVTATSPYAGLDTVQTALGTDHHGRHQRANANRSQCLGGSGQAIDRCGGQICADHWAAQHGAQPMGGRNCSHHGQFQFFQLVGLLELRQLSRIYLHGRRGLGATAGHVWLHHEQPSFVR